MTHIPVNIKVIDEVVSDASLDPRISRKHITSCHACGGIIFYQVVEHGYEGRELATDTCIYCAQCGQFQGGIINDPYTELEISGE